MKDGDGIYNMIKDEREIWTFKYEPQNLNEMVLNDTIRPKLEKAIKEVPNLLLYGSAGVGKGTFTKIYLKETDLPNMWINASDKTGIDFIREDVKPFAYAGSAKLKIVILNEADALSKGQSGAQKMLKQLMEDVQELCRFILMTNEVHQILSPIRSRCIEIPFDNPPKRDIGLFMANILRTEGIKFESKVLANLIKKCYPDIRKTIWAMQENSIDGELRDSDIYSPEDIYAQILDCMFDKNYDRIRVLLRSNYINYVALFNFLYENWQKFKKPDETIMLIGEHLRNDLDYPIKEINFMQMVHTMSKIGAI